RLTRRWVLTQQIVTCRGGTVDGPFGVFGAGVRPQGVLVRPDPRSAAFACGAARRRPNHAGGNRREPVPLKDRPSTRARKAGYLWMTMFPPVPGTSG